MRKFWSVLFGAGLLLLPACQSEEVQKPVMKEESSVNEGESVENARESEQESEKEDQRETKPIVELKENALYTWDLNEQTELLLVKEQGEIEVFEEDYTMGSAGERQFIGNVALYLINKEEGSGVLQEKLEEVTLNIDRAFSDPNLFRDEQFIVWVQPEVSNINTLSMWRFTDDELERVQFDDDRSIIVTNTKMKFLKDTYLQTYTYHNHETEDGGMGWYYTTWKWDDQAEQFTTYATQNYTEDTPYGWESGQQITELWHAHEEDYVLFPEMMMTEEVIGLIKNGQLLDNEIRIGQSIDEVLAIMPDYTVNEYYEGGLYYSFPGPASYFYDEVTRELTGMTLAGASITNDIASIKDIFGEPEVDTYDEMEQLHLLMYTIGDYLLRVHYEENGELSGFWLFRND